MALIKPTLAGSELFGQIGGQNISLTKNGSVIRNTTYSNNAGTTSQTKARLQMASIANKWQFLTPANKALWASTATNYQYKDSAGTTKTRNAYQTFCFCNRNLLEIGKTQLTTPASYVGVTVPIISNNSTNKKEFIIQNSAPDANAEYLIYAQVHNSVGAISFTPTFVKVATITNADFSAGYDVFDDIINNATVPNFECSVTLGIYAVNVNNGNRTTEVVTINQIINPFGLGLNILSYYQFINNGNDYFNINNATTATASFSQNGIIDYSSDYSGLPSTYLFVPNSSSFDFGGVGYSGPFTVCGWFNTNQIKIAILLQKVAQFGFPKGFSWELYLVGNGIRLVLYSGSFPNRARVDAVLPLSINTNYFFAFRYTSPNDVKLFLNTSSSTVLIPVGTYLGTAISNAGILFGRHFSVNPYAFNGKLSEVTIFNGALTDAEIESIRVANLNGQTILDIN